MPSLAEVEAETAAVASGSVNRREFVVVDFKVSEQENVEQVSVATTHAKAKFSMLGDRLTTASDAKVLMAMVCLSHF